MADPVFDPNQPFTTEAPKEEPKFDPSQPFSVEKPQVNTAADVGKSAGIGLVKGVVGLAGLPGDLAGLANRGVDWAENKLGIEHQPANTNLLTTPQLTRALESGTGPLYEPKTTVGKYAQSVGEFAPSILGGPEGLASRAITRAVVPGVTSEVAGQATEGTALEPWARGAAAIAGHAAAQAGRSALGTAARPAVPTIQELHDSADAGYTNARGYGVEVYRQPLINLADTIHSDLGNQGFRPITAPKTLSLVDELRTPLGRHSTIDDIDSVRKSLLRVGMDPTERYAAREAINHIDNYISTLHPNDVAINPHYAGRVANDIVEARGNWAAMKGGQAVLDKISQAELRAGSTYSGGNADNAIRQNIRQFLTNPKLRMQLSAEEREQAERIARGTFQGNVTRWVGKNMRWILGSLVGLHAAGIPGAIGTHLAGHIISEYGNQLTRREAEILARMARADSPLGRRLPQESTLSGPSAYGVEGAIGAQQPKENKKPLQLTIGPRPYAAGGAVKGIKAGQSAAKSRAESNYSPTRGIQNHHCGPDRDWPKGYCAYYKEKNRCTLVGGFIATKGGCAWYKKNDDPTNRADGGGVHSDDDDITGQIQVTNPLGGRITSIPPHLPDFADPIARMANDSEADEISNLFGRTPDDQGTSSYTPRGMYSQRVKKENRGSKIPNPDDPRLLPERFPGTDIDTLEYPRLPNHKKEHDTRVYRQHDYADGGTVEDDKLNYTSKFNSPGGNPGNESYDYDMQGYLNSGGQTKGEGVHYPDTYKKPNHPTFSNESMYHDPSNGLEGGRWEQKENGSYNFYPGKTNIEMHGRDGLKKYFDTYEKGNQIILDNKGYASGGAPEDDTTSLESSAVDPMSGVMQMNDQSKVAGPAKKLFGLDGQERYQLWPERMVRSGLSAPLDALTGELQVNDPETGMPTDEAIRRSIDTAGLAGTGGLANPERTAGTHPRLEGTKHYNADDLDILPPAPVSRRQGVAYSDTSKPGTALGALIGERPTYSAAGEAVRNAKAEVMHPSQWLGYLKNQPGVKPAELEHVGLEDWLAGQKVPVKKSDVDSFIESKQPDIQEVSKGNVSTQQALDDEAMALYGQRYHELDRDHRMEVDDKIDAERLNANTTKYSQHQLPGGENYGETLLTLPKKNITREYGLREAQRFSKQIGEDWNKIPQDERDGYINAAIKQLEENRKSGIGDTAGTYQSSHWDEPNVLLHMRHNDRTLPNGDKSLHLEELQSDWHQAGRKQGYNNIDDIRSKEKQIKVKDAPESIIRSLKDSGWKDFDRIKNEDIYTYGDKNWSLNEPASEETMKEWISNGVPDAPFKQTWPDLGLKRMLHRAATEKNPDGSYKYDSLSWTPGQAQSDRYNLTHRIQDINVVKHGDADAPFFAWWPKNKNGVTLGAVTTDAEGKILKAADLYGDIKGKNISELVGKDVANKGLNATQRETTLSGDDLKFGGEGMKGFYDKILVDKANALTKKYGTKVGKSPLESGNGDFSLKNKYGHYALGGKNEEQATQSLLKKKIGREDENWHVIDNRPKVHSIKITPELRKAAEKGFSLFSDTSKPGMALSGAIEGLPKKISIPGHGFIEAGPHPVARQAAADYMKEAGLPYNPPTKYAKVDPPTARKISDEFEKMKDDPNDPEVKAAYQAMADETMAQWNAIKKTGLKVDFMPEKDPYSASPRIAIEDVKKNNHMYVYPTDTGFGEVGKGISKEQMDANPLLQFSGDKFGGKPARINDIFRVVHDYFGHAKEGVGFRADGEENAWRSHAAMYSPLARRAMTTETRGQNSWLNFGPHGDKNRTARTEDTVFADQKVGLLPKWVSEEGMSDHPSLKKVEGPEESHPDYVYHATNENRAKDISKEGIKLHKPNEFTDQSTWPDGSSSSRNYFTPTAKNSWQFAPEDGKPVLLRVPKKGHPFQKEPTGDIYSKKTVEPDKIEGLDENGNWSPLNKYLLSDSTQPGVGMGAATRIGAPAVRRKPAMEQTVADPQRNSYPGIYKHPQDIVSDLRAQSGTEDPAMKQLFGVNRDDLHEIGKDRVGEEIPNVSWKKRPTGSRAVQNIQTTPNEERILDALRQAEKDLPDTVKGADAWYVMDPAFQRLKEISDNPIKDYNRFNTFTGMASPGSEVTTELNRGTAANYLNNQGNIDQFTKYGGLPINQKVANRKVPRDMADIMGHPYHSTAQAPGINQYAKTNQYRYEKPKVASYIKASGVPETGFQTEFPVIDSHMARGIGLSDTRTDKAFPRSGNLAEAQSIIPWWKEAISDQLGIRPVPAQARQWTVFGPQTGVESAIGAPKLGILSKMIVRTAKKLGLSPEVVRDMVLKGDQYLRAAGGRIPVLPLNITPSNGQKKAGNYRKAHISFMGLPITIENLKGFSRNGIGKDGKKWEVKMISHYGYIKGTKGADEDHIDVYLGENHNSKKIFVVNQKDADTGSFDEHKIFICFSSIGQVRNIFLKSFSDGKGKNRLGNIVEMSVPEFKRFIQLETDRNSKP